jgi:hypothetical protein
MHSKLSTNLIVFFGLVTNMIFSQKGNDTILFINGNSVITTITDTTNGLISFINLKKSKKIKTVDNDRIFSITNSKGEEIVYVYDTLIGNELTVDEMRYYIRGEQDARKVIKGRGGFWTNLLLSAGAGTTGSFLTPIAPFAVAGLLGLPKVKIEEETVSNPEYLNHDTYKMGYEHEGRRKRKIKALFGGCIGLAVGLGTFAILKANGYRILNYLGN